MLMNCLQQAAAAAAGEAAAAAAAGEAGAAAADIHQGGELIHQMGLSN